MNSNADNAKANRTILINFFIIMGVIVLVLGGVTFAINGTRLNATPAPSYQEKNLEVLKIAKPNDLVVCTVDNKGVHEVRRVIIVEQNDGAYLHGYQINSMSVERMKGGHPYFILSDHCSQIWITPPSIAYDNIGRYILHGLNPPKPPAK